MNLTPVSLAPYETVRTFPVWVKGPARVGMQFLTQSLLPGARFVVDSARVTQLDVAPENQKWFVDFSLPRGGASPKY